MKNFVKVVGVIFIMVVIVGACSSTDQLGDTKPVVEEPKKKILTTDEFIDLYVELSVIAERNLTDSVALKEKQDMVFSERGITRDEFYEFEGKISSEPEKWADIWSKIVDKVERRMAEERTGKTPPKMPSREDDSGTETDTERK